MTIMSKWKLRQYEKMVSVTKFHWKHYLESLKYHIFKNITIEAKGVGSKKEEN